MQARPRACGTRDRGARRRAAGPHARSRRRSASIACVNAQMAEGIRLVSISRGIDPRGFTLVPLGGGGRAACDRAGDASSASRTIVVPRVSRACCAAAGLLVGAGRARGGHGVHATRSQRPHADDASRVCERLDRRLRGALMREEGVAADAIQTSYFADVCYVGQSYHLEVPLAAARDADVDAARGVRRLPARCTTGSTATARDRRRASSTCARCIAPPATSTVPPAAVAVVGASASKGTRRILLARQRRSTSTRRCSTATRWSRARRSPVRRSSSRPTPRRWSSRAGVRSGGQRQC